MGKKLTIKFLNCQTRTVNSIFVNSCYRSCAHGQSLLCLQLRADEAYGSVQWKMTLQPRFCVKTADNCDKSYCSNRLTGNYLPGGGGESFAQKSFAQKLEISYTNYEVQCNTVPINTTIANVYMHIRIRFSLKITRNSSRARQPLSRVNLTGFTILTFCLKQETSIFDTTDTNFFNGMLLCLKQVPSFVFQPVMI